MYIGLIIKETLLPELAEFHCPCLGIVLNSTTYTKVNSNIMHLHLGRVLPVTSCWPELHTVW